MITASGVRVAWTDLPAPVRTAAEELLGAAVVTAVSQPGGFSPGSADRVVLSDGRRAFVKAVSSDANVDAFRMHRTEGVVAAALPRGMPTPKFLGSWSDGTWVALCFEDIEGRHPATPWIHDEVVAVLRTLGEIAQLATDPARFPNKPMDVLFAADFAGWERLGPAAALPQLALAHLTQLQTLAAGAAATCGGTAVCHGDMRADNLLIDDAGQVWLIDWPWGAVGAPWIDSMCVLVSIALYGGLDPDDYLDATPTLRSVPPDQVNMFLAGLAAFFVYQSSLPAPPGLPTIRLFQQQHGEAVLAWLARRLNW